ncbi:hypothetical protein [Roseibium sp. LAB1]
MIIIKGGAGLKKPGIIQDGAEAIKNAWTTRSHFALVPRDDISSSKARKGLAPFVISFFACTLHVLASGPGTALTAPLDQPQAQWIVDAAVDGGEISSMILGTLLLCSTGSWVRPPSSQKNIEK